MATTTSSYTPRQTSEHVSGPGNGLIPLAAVLLLTALTWGGLWGLHQHWYHDPMNPIEAVQ